MIESLSVSWPLYYLIAFILFIQLRSLLNANKRHKKFKAASKRVAVIADSVHRNPDMALMGQILDYRYEGLDADELRFVADSIDARKFTKEQ